MVTRITLVAILVIGLLALAIQVLGAESGITQIIWIISGTVTIFCFVVLKRLLVSEEISCSAVIILQLRQTLGIPQNLTEKISSLQTKETKSHE